jgi:hypothetical protein
MKHTKVNTIRVFASLLFVHFCPLVLNAQTSDELSRSLEMLQTRGEVIVRFILPGTASLDELTRNLSIDKRKGDTLTAYASEKQFKWFIAQKIPFHVLLPRSVANPVKDHRKSTASALDTYPTYTEYLQMMESFASDYPDRCMLKEFGTTVNGRKLLAVKISDNPTTHEAEPAFLYTSTLHGDEGTGYMLMLRLTDSLLNAYNTNEVIKELIDNTEIWINPIFNPDGFYFASDSLSINSTRYNANHADLNRNFPDALAGDHPDGMDWQPETIAMMNFMRQHTFVLAANLHDGAELVNYPWDNRSARHADDSWYLQLSRQFADTVHLYSPTGFFSDEENGITNGSDWYVVYGGRQDYVNYFLHGREVTIELSHVKSVDPSEFTDFWNYYKKSLIGYMQQIHPGIHGKVTDAATGEPLKAMIEIPGHDRDSSQVFSSAETGEFYRLLPAGNYTFTITSPGYSSQNIEFSLIANETKEMTINLLPSARELSCFPVPFTHTLTFLLPDDSINDLYLSFTDMAGRLILNEILPDVQGYASLTKLDGLARGVYLVKIRHGSLIEEMKVVK